MPIRLFLFIFLAKVYRASYISFIFYQVLGTLEPSN